MHLKHCCIENSMLNIGPTRPQVKYRAMSICGVVINHGRKSEIFQTEIAGS